MPERIAFMDIIQKNISESAMKTEIDNWSLKLAPNVKRMFDTWHANYTLFLERGKTEVLEAFGKVDTAIDKLVNIRRDLETTFTEQHAQQSEIMLKLTRRQRHLLKEMAWEELRDLDEYPYSNMGSQRT
ncbi:unnamed protein product, partial [Mesorhabditis spiculigera]